MKLPAIDLQIRIAASNRTKVKVAASTIAAVVRPNTIGLRHPLARPWPRRVAMVTTHTVTVVTTRPLLLLHRHPAAAAAATARSSIPDTMLRHRTCLHSLHHRCRPSKVPPGSVTNYYFIIDYTKQATRRHTVDTQIH